jgi:hypothetical protein
MKWFTTIAEEVLSLFVDDGSFAIAIIIWLGIAWFLSIHILAALHWSGLVLFVGLIAILLQNAVRRARQ